MNNKPNRFLTLDVFRGIDVALMIVVNSVGGFEAAYAPLLHSQWNGFTLTDLVFPTFLFIAGIAISFSMANVKLAGTRAVLSKILIRTTIIFLLGYLMYWFPFIQHAEGGWALKPIADTRIFGVLQRIALCYGLAMLIIHFGGIKWSVGFGILALGSYWFILSRFGDLTLQGNAVLKLDLFLVGPSHLYMGEGVPFDPEGLLSTLPAIVNVLAGYVTGVFIHQSELNSRTISKLIIGGIWLSGLGLLWNPLFPINKKLWTSSFVLYTVGLDLIILAVLIYIIEIVRWRKWTSFFKVFGKNALFIYIFSELFVLVLYTIHAGKSSLHLWIYSNLIRPWAGSYNGSLVFGLWVMLTCWLLGFLLDQLEIYIKV